MCKDSKTSCPSVCIDNGFINFTDTEGKVSGCIVDIK